MDMHGAYLGKIFASDSRFMSCDFILAHQDIMSHIQYTDRSVENRYITTSIEHAGKIKYFDGDVWVVVKGKEKDTQGEEMAIIPSNHSTF